MDFYIGKVFEGTYPPEAAAWCNERSDCSIRQVEGGYQIVENPKPTNAELAENTRIKRDHLLSETDFYLMSDYPSDPKNLEEIKKYRQALRDIPEQAGFPKDVIWPALPKFLCEDSEGLGLAKIGL